MPVAEGIALAAAVFKAIPPGQIAKIAKSVHESRDKFAAKFESTFSKHVADTMSKCSEVHTIFADKKKIPLKSIYTNLYIDGPRRIRDDDILKKLPETGSIVISGTGGAGKTMLMKYLALSSIEYPIGVVPLFVELRNLPEHIPSQFYKTLFEYFCEDSDDGNFNVFREGLRNGIFVIFFDGLDEVQSARREQVFNSIKRMARSFPNCWIVASSRPEIDTRNWGELSTFGVRGLTLNQAKHLISKVEFPKALKTEFSDLLDEKFFQTHRSFLSVPLLCSLMLLTYHEYQTVPSRITVFYEQAFETLLRRHDRAKEGHFKREMDCGLSSDRFKSIFSAFCYRTLAFQEVSFTDDKFRHHLGRASEVMEISVDVDQYAIDLVSGVCVIMRDGLNLHFIHRSFQEYFAAIYLLRTKNDSLLEMYNRVFNALNVNDVAKMAFDIDAQAFERDWALPATKSIMKSISEIEASNQPLELLKSLWLSLRLDEDDHSFSTYSWSAGQRSHETLLQLSKVYGSTYPDLRLSFSGQSEEFGSIRELIDNFNGADSYSDFRDVNGYDEDENFVEVTLSKHDISWIRETTMYPKLEKLVVSISKLCEDLESRATSRGKIDLLD